MRQVGVVLPDEERQYSPPNTLPIRTLQDVKGGLEVSCFVFYPCVCPLGNLGRVISNTASFSLLFHSAIHARRGDPHMSELFV